MIRHRKDVYAGMMALLVSGVCALAASQPNTSATERTALLPDLDKLLTAPAGDLEQQSTSSRELESLIESASEPMDKINAHLAAANWLLAVPTARPATLWLLGISRPEDVRAISESATKAQTHLSEAGKLLKEQSSGDAKTESRRLSTKLATLKSFADVMVALNKEAPDKSRETWSELALGLSEARESEVAPIASAATLWQAAAWLQAGRRERAMTLLPDALVKPDQPFDFISRLLRCRSLAEEGEYGAAMALTNRIRSSIDHWFPQDKPAEQASKRRLVGLVQLWIGQEWGKKLKAGTQPADADLLNDVLARLKKDFIAANNVEPEVYVLDQAVPILVKPPTVNKETKSAPASEPSASEPAGEPESKPESAPTE